MTPVQTVRDVSRDDVEAAARVLASALCVLLLSVLFAFGAVVVLLLPLAVLATVSPTLSFGVPPTQYPTVWLGAQAVWTVLFGLGLFALTRAARLAPAFDATVAREPAYSRTYGERLAGLVEAVQPDEGK